MTTDEEVRVAGVSRTIAAPHARIFELIADPSLQPAWDGNANLARAAKGQRVHGVGEVFTMHLVEGKLRENHVVEFEEGLLIAWRPAEPGRQPPGHLWRWELQPLEEGLTQVTHTYDWSELTDPRRFVRARATTAEKLKASLDRLATAAELSDY